MSPRCGAHLRLRAGVWFATPRRLTPPPARNEQPLPEEAYCDLRATFDADDLVEAALRAESWFLRWEELDGVLGFLLSADVDDTTWGHGTLGSPTRNYLIGYLAREAGDGRVAREHLTQAARWFRGSLEEHRSSYSPEVISAHEAWIARIDADALSA